jgi:hypothetical protein
MTQFQMSVTVNNNWKIEVTDAGEWKGVILECPDGKIRNALPKGEISQVMVDTARQEVVSLVRNPVAEQQQQRRDDAAARKKYIARVVDDFGPDVGFRDSAYRHFNGTDGEVEDAIKWYLSVYTRYEVTGATEDYTFTLDIDPPNNEFRYDDDTLDNWTIGGGITRWRGDSPAAVTIWHFGPVTAQY